ncbi:hypothetical protein [Desulfosarcina ovata]|nr:hypothetical protein [Desulfosarcina ovata]
MTRQLMIPIRAALLGAVLSVVFTVAVGSPPARAYVLDSTQIFGHTAEAMGAIATLRCHQKLLIYPQTPDTPPTIFEETTIYVMPLRFRSDIVSTRIRRTHLVYAGRSLTVIDGRTVVGESPFDRYQGILRSRTRGQLMQSARQLGIDTDISSLGRIEQSVVFVIGADYPDESVSQLAIDKKTFFPVRLLLVVPGSRMEIYYRKWQPVQKSWFPYQITFHINGHLAREIRVTELEANPSVPADLMDLEALKASAAPSDSAPQRQNQEAVDTVQQAVEDFQKKFE